MKMLNEWSEWLTLDAGTLNDAASSIPKKSVYLIRSRRAFSRVFGVSPLVYIGAVEGNSNRSTSQRMNGLVAQNNPPHTAFNGIQKLLKLGETLEFCVWQSELPDPEAVKASLLCFYEKIHLELPPLNHQRGAKNDP